MPAIMEKMDTKDMNNWRDLMNSPKLLCLLDLYENRKAIKTYKATECSLPGGHYITVVCAGAIPKRDAATVARVPEYRVTVFKWIMQADALTYS